MKITHYREHVARLGKEYARAHRLYLETGSGVHEQACQKAYRAWMNARCYLRRREKSEAAR